jgi:hypothetical protein
VFRETLKGQPTEFKLQRLEWYYEYTNGGDHWTLNHRAHSTHYNLSDCDVCLRVDNYIKALCRGGQLLPGASLAALLDTDWSRDWIKK